MEKDSWTSVDFSVLGEVGYPGGQAIFSDPRPEQKQVVHER